MESKDIGVEVRYLEYEAGAKKEEAERRLRRCQPIERTRKLFVRTA